MNHKKARAGFKGEVSQKGGIAPFTLVPKSFVITTYRSIESDQLILPRIVMKIDPLLSPFCLKFPGLSQIKRPILTLSNPRGWVMALSWVILSFWLGACTPSLSASIIDTDGIYETRPIHHQMALANFIWGVRLPR